MSFWKLCAIAAVLALNTQVVYAQAGDETPANEGENGETTDNQENAGEEGVEEEPTETPEKVSTMPELIQGQYDAEMTYSKAYDGNCLQCIYAGYSFCSEDAKESEGKCHPAICKEGRTANEDNACTLGENSLCQYTDRLAFSQCEIAAFEEQATKCPSKITITDKDVDFQKDKMASAEADKIEYAYQPSMEVDVTIPMGQACTITIVSDVTEERKAAFEITERHMSINSVMTVLSEIDKTTTDANGVETTEKTMLQWNDATTQLVSAETSDFSNLNAGRIFVEPGKEYVLTLMNASDDKDATLKIQKLGATTLFTSVAATMLALAHLM